MLLLVLSGWNGPSDFQRAWPGGEGRSISSVDAQLCFFSLFLLSRILSFWLLLARSVAGRALSLSTSWGWPGRGRRRGVISPPQLWRGRGRQDGSTDTGWLAECGRSANRVLSRGARCELEKNHPLRRSASVSTLKILGSSDAQQNPAERAVQRTDQIPRLLARSLDRSGSPPRAPPNAVRVRKSF